MYCATFIFAKRQFDDAFHALDQNIAAIAKGLPGYLGEEAWENRHTGLFALSVRLDPDPPLEATMHTLTVEDLARQPRRLLEDAERGEPSLVTRSRKPVMLAVPLATGLDAHAVRLELAARLYDHQQISLGVAAHIAGVSYSEMIDELGRRNIAVIRLDPGELERELGEFGL